METAMKALLVSSALGLGLLLSAGAWAEAPAGATASCKDGTYYTGTTHKGACRGHKGVKEWLNADSSAASGAAAATETAKPAKKSKKSKKAEAAEAAAPAAAPAPAPAPAATAPAAAAPAAKAPTSKHTPPTPASQITAKPGGGPGLVWVNSGSKVYHCQGDEWYGKTKEGSYMSEAAAKAAGNHASHGKECGK
jgi:biotin carboxyl carrier protein